MPALAGARAGTPGAAALGRVPGVVSVPFAPGARPGAGMVPMGAAPVIPPATLRMPAPLTSAATTTPRAAASPPSAATPPAMLPSTTFGSSPSLLPNDPATPPAVTLSQSNPGTQDLSTPADPNAPLSPQTGTASATSPQTGTDMTTLQTAPQSGSDPTAALLNPDTTTSAEILSINGALPPPFEASSGGRSLMGARGKDMQECMEAWDTKTHITKSRWREICSRTLASPHV
jgi:hypothetical protein